MAIAAISIYLSFVLLAFLAQRRLIFHPEKLGREHLFDFGSLEFREIWLKAGDGIDIHGLHFPHPDPKGAILYFHGNSGSIDKYGVCAQDFIDRGWEVFMIDYRGYGKSEGKITEAGMYLDAEAAWNYLRQTFPPEKIVIYGRSMGSGVGSWLAQQHPEARLLALETPYTSVLRLARSSMWMLPVRGILRFHFRTDKRAPHIKMPVAIFHGDKDEVVPFQHGQELKHIFGAQAAFYPIYGGFHNDIREHSSYHEALSVELDKAALPPDQTEE